MIINNKKRISIGSWPGESYSDNEFVRSFCLALKLSNCDVIDVVDIFSPPSNIDILHIHWPEKILWDEPSRFARVSSIFKFIRSIRRCSKNGIKIVWMVHNIEPHDMSLWGRICWFAIKKYLPPICDAYITLSPSTVALARDAFKLKHAEASFAYLPVYSSQNISSRTSARQALGLPIDKIIFGFVGTVKPYKGLEDLIEAFNMMGSPTTMLYIAGELKNGPYRDKISSLIGDNGQIVFLPDRLTVERLESVFSAVDVAVFPYRKYLHSSAIVHALSCRCPTIVANSAFVQDLSSIVGASWLTIFDSKLSAPVLADWVEPVESLDLSQLDLLVFGQKVSAFYHKILGRSYDLTT